MANGTVVYWIYSTALLFLFKIVAKYDFVQLIIRYLFKIVSLTLKYDNYVTSYENSALNKSFNYFDYYLLIKISFLYVEWVANFERVNIYR